MLKQFINNYTRSCIVYVLVEQRALKEYLEI